MASIEAKKAARKRAGAMETFAGGKNEAEKPRRKKRGSRSKVRSDAAGILGLGGGTSGNGERQELALGLAGTKEGTELRASDHRHNFDDRSDVGSGIEHYALASPGRSTAAE